MFTIAATFYVKKFYNDHENTAALFPSYMRYPSKLLQTLLPPSAGIETRAAKLVRNLIEWKHRSRREPVFTRGKQSYEVNYQGLISPPRRYRRGTKRDGTMLEKSRDSVPIINRVSNHDFSVADFPSGSPSSSLRIGKAFSSIV